MMMTMVVVLQLTRQNLLNKRLASQRVHAMNSTTAQRTAVKFCTLICVGPRRDMGWGSNFDRGLHWEENLLFRTS